MTETVETRRVRVVIEGDAHPVSATSDILRVSYGPHHSVMVHQSMDNVTVEDVPEGRVWTDGDVVQSKRATYDRWGGLWRSTLTTADYRDSDIEYVLSLGAARVLRYQAGEQ